MKRPSSSLFTCTTLGGVLPVLLLCVSWLFASCGDSDDPDNPEPAPQTTSLAVPTVSDITEISATLTTTITGSASGMTKHGFCYGTSANPDLNATVASLTSGWTAYLTNLEPSTTYYVRAFLTNAQGTIYSQQTSFTTSEKPYVDPLIGYTPPTYKDDYRSFAGWNDRAKWNLANVHDPTVMKADDGYYYMYQTDAGFGNPQDGHGHFHCRRSKNMVDWEYMGATMTELPSWVKTKLNEIHAAMGLGDSKADFSKCGYWAPCARRVSANLYRMYYVITIDGTIDGTNNSWGERAFIGLMETSTPQDIRSWQDKGFVITNYSDRELNFHVRPDNWGNCYYRWNAIDPSYIITPNGEHWLIYGSWHSGFPAVQLNPDTGKPMHELGNPWGAANAANYGKRVYTRENGNRWQGSEAPEVIYRNGYYYLFMAYDGLDIPYNTRVVRSTKVDGPYLNYQGSDVTNGGDAYPIITHPYKFAGDAGWVGISHCAVWEDGQDNWFFSCQGRFPTDYPVMPEWAPNAVMLGHVRRILWTEDGWPVVLPERYGAVPQKEISEAEIVGTWDHLSITYKYGQQISSVSATFSADHTVSGGPFSAAKWSFDPAKNILTIGNYKLCVAREVDWEANPRHATIVYAGYTPQSRNNPTTFWGKKK